MNLNVFLRAALCLGFVGLAADAVPVSNVGEVAASRGLLLVANKGNHTLGVIDPGARKQIAAVDVEGITGHEVAASPDGKRAFVPIFGSGGVGGPGTDGQLIRVIDLGQNRVVGTIDFGKGMRPHEALFSPRDGLLYVTTELDDSVSIIDPESLKVAGRVPTGQSESHMLALTRDGRRAVTSNVGPGTVSVLDLEARKVLKVIPVADVAQRISLSADDRWAFTSDQQKPRLAVIDLDRGEVVEWIELPGIGYGTAPTRDGKVLLVAMPRARQVAFVDLKERKVAGTLEVPRAPQEVLIRPDGATAYVSCDAAGQVAEIDIAARKVSALIQAGPGADGLAWAVR